MKLEDDAGRPLGSGGRPFTDEQAIAVVRRDGPLLLSANAGSGKTSVLAERVVRSVVQDGLRPDELLAITFTEKAAGELRSRIRARFVELGERAAARDVEGAWIGTIHGFCARVLRAHAPAAGLDPGFVVLDEAAARELRTRSWERALAGWLGRGADVRTARLDLLAAHRPDRLRAAIEGAHDLLRSRGLPPVLPPATPRGELAGTRAALRDAAATALDELSTVEQPGSTVQQALADLRACLEDLDAGGHDIARGLKLARRGAAMGSEACDACREAVAALDAALVDVEALEQHALLGDLLERFAAELATAKREVSGLDFDDLQLHARDLLATVPAIAAAYRTRFRRVMVDEFQDTNPLQIALLDALGVEDRFLVGDALQSIYGFRHADVAVFRRMRDELAGRGAAAELRVSWRAQPELLATINAAFGGLHDDWVPLVPGRAGDPSPEPRTEVLLVDAAIDGLDDERLAALQAGMPSARPAQLAEARAVARRVRELVDEGTTSAGDVVVLLRSAKLLHVFERALELEGLATLASGGRGFWQREQVQDLTAYLAVLANPRDGAALHAVLGSPLVGLSSDALALVALAARRAGRAAWDVLPDAVGVLARQDAQRLEVLLTRLAREREDAPRLALDALIARVVADTGYDLHVLRLPGGRRRLANVHKLEQLAARFEAEHGREVRAFIDHVAAEVEAEAREAEAPVELEGLDAVRLMTTHAAKGLEFGVVVVADLGHGRPGGAPDVLVGDHGEVGLRVVRLDGTSADGLQHAELKRAAAQAAVREEQRIFHVAVTRAEERLVLSGVTPAAGWPKGGDTAPPLAWVGPRLGEGLLDALAAAVDRRALVERDGIRLTARLVDADHLRLPPPRAAEAPGEPAAAPPVQLALDVEAGLAAAVEAAPQPPAQLSFSALADYDRCAYRFYLQRVLRLPESEPPAGAPARPGVGPALLDPLARGSAVHLLLERGDLAPSDEAIAAACARFDLDATPAALADVRRLVRAFADSPLAGRLDRAVTVHRERAFALDLGEREPLVAGILDVLAEEGDGRLLVVDFKTNDVGDADLAAVVEAGYALQRTIYALAALRSGAHEAEVAYCFLERPAETVAVAYAQADVPALEAAVRRAAAGPLAGRFPVTDTPHLDLCRTCPGRGTLCSWPSARVLVPLADAVSR